MVFFIIFVVILFAVIFIFSSPALSPVPYFPSNKKDLSLILKSLDLKNNQTIIDLGAGDGLVIFEAANASYKKRLDTTYVGVDINPILVLIMNIRRFFHPNRDNIKIVHGDFFRPDFMDFIDFKDLVTIYLYISHWLIEKTIKNLKIKNIKFNIVSYMYPIKSLKKIEKSIRGVNNIFIYQ